MREDMPVMVRTKAEAAILRNKYKYQDIYSPEEFEELRGSKKYERLLFHDWFADELPLFKERVPPWINVTMYTTTGPDFEKDYLKYVIRID
jgi:hypothetical protein